MSMVWPRCAAESAAQRARLAGKRRTSGRKAVKTSHAIVEDSRSRRAVRRADSVSRRRQRPSLATATTLATSARAATGGSAVKWASPLSRNLSWLSRRCRLRMRWATSVSRRSYSTISPGLTWCGRAGTTCSQSAERIEGAILKPEARRRMDPCRFRVSLISSRVAWRLAACFMTTDACTRRLPSVTYITEFAG